MKSSFKLPENLTIDYKNYSILAESFSAVSPKLWFSGLNPNKMYEILMFEYVFILKFYRSHSKSLDSTQTKKFYICRYLINICAFKLITFSRQSSPFVYGWQASLSFCFPPKVVETFKQSKNKSTWLINFCVAIVCGNPWDSDAFTTLLLNT